MRYYDPKTRKIFEAGYGLGQKYYLVLYRNKVTSIGSHKVNIVGNDQFKTLAEAQTFLDAYAVKRKLKPLTQEKCVELILDEERERQRR